MERFDPFESEERLWTLVSRNGKTPTDDEQSEYRRRRLKAWKKANARKAGRKSMAEAVKVAAKISDFNVSSPATPGPNTYTFVRAHAHLPIAGDIPSVRRTYVVDETAKRVLHTTWSQLEPASILAGQMKVDRLEVETQYGVVDPSLPPFPVTTKTVFCGRFFGKETGDSCTETIYSDYHRVTCYDDRFAVKIGEPTLSELIPDDI